ncbi:MAG: DNA gyrase subunit A [Thermoplasmatales archaeon]|nr:DNA gyrase subunit A [Thermoplasmatales archaeon]
MISDERILIRAIEEEMKTSYLDYSMSVIIGRALPDVRDGLKPVHRRILYAMNEMGIRHNKAHRKSARIVGDVLGKYHPHGDQAVYDALVRMAQPFSMRYPLVDGQGNFGSIDGDEPAAMRYTEARLSKISEEILKDIDKDTVTWRDNFDGTLKEPDFLPSLLPNLLVNGSRGIAVGMATEIPPHNLNEVVDAVIATIDNPDITIQELFNYIKGPDFPTGGIICGRGAILNAYEKGQGVIKVRAKTRIEEDAIIVNEIPYGVNKSKLIKDIANLVKKGKIEGIAELRDESDRSGLRIFIRAKKGIDPEIVLNQLFKHTQLEISYGILNIAIVDGTPKILNLKEMIVEYIKHRKNIITRRCEYELKKAIERKHILEGLVKALENIDMVVDIIKKSKDSKEAMENLIKSFNFSQAQAKEIISMPLSKLTSFETDEIRKEKIEKENEIEKLNRILGDKNEIYKIIKEELIYLKSTYGDERRTEIVEEISEFDREDFIPEENIIIILTDKGYIKRVKLEEYKSQRRGGKGILGMKVKDEDEVYRTIVSSTHDVLLFFSSDGKIYKKKAYEIPQGDRYSKGRAIINLLGSREIKEILPVKNFDDYLIFATKKGMVKKTSLKNFINIRRNGIIAIKLDKGDEIIGVKILKENDKIVLSTRNGYACVFNEKDVRAMGRNARGVRGIKLRGDDEVVSLEIGKDDLLTVTEKGYGKRTSIDEYRLTKRGAKGVITIKISEKNGKVVGVLSVREGDEILISTSQGMIERIKVSDVRKQGRNTIGVRLIKLSEEDRIKSVTKISF